MTDLEKQWDEFPVGKAPVGDILAGARTRERRRRRRPVLGGVAVVAACATFAVVAVTNGSSTTGGVPAAADQRPVAFQADLTPAASCDELLATYRERAAKQVTAWGWSFGEWGDYAPSAAFSRLATDRVTAQVSSATGTNVQEPGIDEPDIVKTDGRILVQLRGDRLVVHDVTGPSPRRTGEIRLPHFRQGEILLVDSTVVAVGADALMGRDASRGGWRGARVVTVSVDGTSPRIRSTTTYSSRVLLARQTGSTVRLVLDQEPPDLDFIQPSRFVSVREARTANRRTVRESLIEDWLPTRDAGEGPEPLVDCTDVAAPGGSTGIGTVSVVGFTVDEPTPSTVALVGSASIAYASADHVYLAENEYRRSATVRLHDFELDGVHAVHAASGRVSGSVADRWSIDEADGVLRVAVAKSRANAVVTLQRHGDRLVRAGKVGGLGRNEHIKAVRWFDDLAVVVTYREIDPLYTIDVADPVRPRLLGVLKIPGFSDYLHPIGNDRLVGVGYADAREKSAQVSLFDASDLSKVARVDTVTHDATRVLAPEDPRTFTWLPRRSTALTVVRSGRTASVAAVTVDGDRLTSRLTPVGARSSEVRTVALPDDRVALVAGADVSFFELP